MKVVVVSVLFVLVFFSGMFVYGIDDASFSGIVFEIILTKLEYLQNNLDDLREKMQVMESAMTKAEQKLSSDISQLAQRIDLKLFSDSSLKKLVQTIDQKLKGVDTQLILQSQNVATQQSLAKKDSQLFDEKHSTEMTSAIKLLGQTLVHNITSVYDQTKFVSHERQNSNEHRLAGVSQAINQQNQPNIKSILNNLNVSVQSCKTEPSKRSGKYFIKPTAYDVPFVGFCEQAAHGGGWLVFQYRYDGSVDFYRNWADYRNGFGNMDGEFWLGLEHLHRLTSTRPHELLVELKDYNGNYKYAHYDGFEIADENNQYELQHLGKFTGTAEHALYMHKGMKFTTKDRDNDLRSRENCASLFKGAWWYNSCAYSNLNGLYKNSSTHDSMSWSTTRVISHVYTRMLIRET